MAGSIAEPALRVGAKSHVGKVRTENQDRMSRFTSPLGELFIVADGMGGHQGGMTAVIMTIDGFDISLRNAAPGVSAHDALQSAAQQTNERIYRLANSNDPAIAKMGSTVVLALISAGRMWIGHAGDSRAYLYRQGKLSRLTKDHSVVQKMIDHNMLSEEEARNHPDASVINRAFGQSPELELEISEPIEMRPGDGLLLCTDGLSGYVSDEEIAQRIGRHGDAQEITGALIDLALEAGGEDNVTVQYVLFVQNGKTASEVPAQSSDLERQSFAGSADQKAVTKPRFSGRTSVALIVGGFLFGLLLGWFVAGGTTASLRAWWQKRISAAASPSPTPKNRDEQPSPEPSREIPKGDQQSRNYKSGEEAPLAPGKSRPKPSPASPSTNDVPE